MTLALPDLPLWSEVTAYQVAAGGSTNESPLDGTTEMVLRVGDKHAVDVALPPLEPAQARRWLAAWKASTTRGDTVTLAWPQPPLAAPAGAPKVNGANQTGSQLIVDGLTPHVLLPMDSFFSFQTGGSTYIHSLLFDVVADAAGAATLDISPMLRVKPADNADLDFATPRIEGRMTSWAKWTLQWLCVHGMNFTVQELR